MMLGADRYRRPLARRLAPRRRAETAAGRAFSANAP